MMIPLIIYAGLFLCGLVCGVLCYLPVYSSQVSRIDELEHQLPSRTRNGRFASKRGE